MLKYGPINTKVKENIYVELIPFGTLVIYI